MNVKQAIIQYVPQWAILRPSNAKEKMGLQSFNLGNCTIMIISNHGTVPISSAMGVALGIIDHLINFIIDTPFNGGKKLIL